MKLPRQMVRGKFLSNLSQKDIRFVMLSLARDGNEADSLLKLLTDDGTRGAILDSAVLWSVASNLKKVLPLSQELYFYILLRNALKEQSVFSPEVAAFLAEAISVFPPAPRPGVHTADYEEALKNAKDYEWFVLALELANRSLILSGIYGKEIYITRQDHAIASLNRYENIGRNHYRLCSKNKLAEEFDLKEILLVLAEDFQKVRAALESIRESYLRVTEGKA